MSNWTEDDHMSPEEEREVWEAEESERLLRDYNRCRELLVEAYEWIRAHPVSEGAIVLSNKLGTAVLPPYAGSDRYAWCGYLKPRAALQSHNEGRDGVGNDNDGREDSQP